MDTWYDGHVMEQTASLSPGRVGYISYPMFIEPTITRIPLMFSGYIGLDTKMATKKKDVSFKYFSYVFSVGE